MSQVDVTSLKQVAFEAIEREREALGELATAIWDKPELLFEEHAAHDLLTAFLEARGFHVDRHFLLPTAFRASFSLGDKVKVEAEGRPVVAVLCEYDALPDIGHACGHNLIAEVGVAAGIAIKAAMETAGLDLGKVYVIGTPAEEGGGGKILLLQGGAFTDVDVALMAHPGKKNSILPLLPSLCNQRVQVTFKGKASHASAAPWDGVNALDAAVMAYSSISVLRQQFKPDWRVHGVITNGGSKPNIIPEMTELQYYIRASARRDHEELLRRFKACMQAAADATGCTVEFKWGERPYLCVLTNKVLAEAYASNLAAAGKVLTPADQVQVTGGASTDFGNVSFTVPGIHPVFQITSTASEHTRDFAAAAREPTAQVSAVAEAKCLAATAIDVFTDPDLLSKIKSAFAADIAAESSSPL